MCIIHTGRQTYTHERKNGVPSTRGGTHYTRHKCWPHLTNTRAQIVQGCNVSFERKRLFRSLVPQSALGSRVLFSPFSPIFFHVTSLPSYDPFPAIGSASVSPFPSQSPAGPFGVPRLKHLVMAAISSLISILIEIYPCLLISWARKRRPDPSQRISFNMRKSSPRKIHPTGARAPRPRSSNPILRLVPFQGSPILFLLERHPISHFAPDKAYPSLLRWHPILLLPLLRTCPLPLTS